jgi:hypothetical protein
VPQNRAHHHRRSPSAVSLSTSGALSSHMAAILPSMLCRRLTLCKFMCGDVTRLLVWCSIGSGIGWFDQALPLDMRTAEFACRSGRVICSAVHPCLHGMINTSSATDGLQRRLSLPAASAM